MEKLKVLERAAQAIHHLLLSFEILEKKSEPLKQHLQCIRNLLPAGSPNTFVSKVETDTEKVRSAKQVQLEIQSFQKGLSRIIVFFLVGEPNPNPSETNSEFDIKCYKIIASAVNLIITNCMEGFQNLLGAGENDGLDLSNLALPECVPTLTPPPLNVPSNSKKRRISNSIEEIATQAEAVLNENLDEKGGSSQKKPKPVSPMELAFKNDVVLLEIFRHSSPSDLKEFRLVNRQWNDTATSTLLIRKSLELFLGELQEEDRDGFESTSDQMTSAPGLPSQAKSEIGLRGSVTDLCHLIESSAKFPSKSLLFDCKNAELPPHVRQLLEVFGTQVKELTLVYYCEVSTSCLRELLLDLVPNLESLILRGTILVAKKQLLSTSDLDMGSCVECDRIQSLPQLKQLVFLPCEDKFKLVEPKSNYLLHMEFFKELVNAAMNLRSVHTHPLDFVEVLLDAGKVQLVKKLDFQPTRKEEKRLGGTVEVRSDVIYRKLASMKPEIRTLKTEILKPNDGFGYHLFENFESELNSILESSKDSLCDLQMEMLPGFLIHWPVFTNLEKFKIQVDDKLRGDITAISFYYHPTFSFQRNFPHLHELHLWLYSYMEVHIKNLFRGKLEKWINPTVKHLEFQGNMSYQEEREIESPYKGPGMLGKMFPNATSVVIAYDQYEFDEQQLSSIIWHQIPVGVKRLNITQFPAQDLVLDIVDSFFTGMSIKMCKSLRKFPQRICAENDSATLGALRTEPSICDFKNLEELNICCYDLRSDQPFASHVTGLYTFGLMPQLNVTITYEPEVEGSGNATPSQDMERALKQIARPVHYSSLP